MLIYAKCSDVISSFLILFVWNVMCRVFVGILKLKLDSVVYRKTNNFRIPKLWVKIYFMLKLHKIEFIIASIKSHWASLTSYLMKDFWIYFSYFYKLFSNQHIISRVFIRHYFSPFFFTSTLLLNHLRVFGFNDFSIFFNYSMNIIETFWTNVIYFIPLKRSWRVDPKNGRKIKYVQEKLWF